MNGCDDLGRTAASSIADRDGGRDGGIKVEGLSRLFGELRAVDDVSLEVLSGEVFGFLGPNGAGKTTLVRMLTTILAPTSGRALVAGHDVVREAPAVRKAIGVALQDVGLDPLMTGRELLILQGRLFGLTAADAAGRAECLLELVGLHEVAPRKRIGQYSGGMKRRLDLALALVHQPRVLFLDEPTTGLDPVSRAGIWDEVRRLNRDQGVTVFLTTQYLEEADRLANRVAIINQGRIVASGAPEQLKQNVGDEVVTLSFGSLGAAADGARAVSGIAPRTQVSGGEVFAYFPTGVNAVPALVRALDAASIPVTGLNVRQPSLDDVFLRLTGERLTGAAGGGDGGLEAEGRSAEIEAGAALGATLLPGSLTPSEEEA